MSDVFYNKTVTVYNKISTGGVVGSAVWYPTVLTDARLIVSKGANITKSGIESADSAKLSVRKLDDYLEPIEWKQSSDKASHFTFSEDGDFFVEGDTSAEDSTQSGFYAYMKTHYDNCFKVTTCDRFYLIPHLEVGGK